MSGWCSVGWGSVGWSCVLCCPPPPPPSPSPPPISNSALLLPPPLLPPPLASVLLHPQPLITSAPPPPALSQRCLVLPPIPPPTPALSQRCLVPPPNAPPPPPLPQGLLTNSVMAEVSDVKPTNPHRGPITTLFFFPAEPLLLTAGGDNAMKLFSFGTLGICKKLKERQGHFKPLTQVRFFGDSLVLTAAEDRTMRVHNVFTDRLNREVSQGNVAHNARKGLHDEWDMRLPPVRARACVWGEGCGRALLNISASPGGWGGGGGSPPLRRTRISLLEKNEILQKEILQKEMLVWLLWVQ